MRNLINNKKVEWYVAFDNISIVGSNYGSGYIPTLYVIDQNQNIAYSEIGFKFEEILNALDQLGLDSTRPISPNGSFNGIPSLDIIPTIFITGIGIMAIFIIGTFIYGWYQQRKQVVAYQTQYDSNQEQTAFRGFEKSRLNICPNCSQSIPSKAKFCMNCGSDLTHD